MKLVPFLAVAVFVGLAHQSVAQTPLGHNELSLGAGVAIPTGQLGSAATTGVNAAAIAEIPIGLSPFSVRILGSYSRFGADNSVAFASSTGSIPKDGAQYLEGNAGFGYNFPTSSAAKPYLTLGWGYYHSSGRVPSNLPGGDGKANHLGGSFGGGVKFNAGARKLFVDGRYVTVAGGDHYVPVIIGISF